MSRRLGIILVAVLLLAGLGLAAFHDPAAERMPDITLQTLDGRQLQLASLAGRPVLVTFWATTCSTCLEEIPQLAALYRELAPRGLEVIAIAMPYDPPNRVLELVQRRELPYTVALDLAGEATQAFGQVQVTPNWFLITAEGKIIQQQVGRIDMQALRQQILAMLPSQAQRTPTPSG